MSDEGATFVLGLFIGIVLALVVGFASHGLTDEAWRKEAIGNHAAEYRINPKTGETSFVWLTSEAKE